MNRLEFCDLMEKAKERSGTRISDISFQMHMLLPTLRRLEKGQHNFNMKKCIEYLDVIKSKITLGSQEIHTYDELVETIVNIRTKSYSQRSLAEKIGMSYVSIAHVERHKAVMSVDMFLLIAQALELEINIITYD